MVAAVRYAADDRVPLTVGRGLPAPGGVLVDTGGLDAVVVGRDRVVVGAGTTWRRLLTLTAARGLAPAAPPDDLDRSVGASVVVADAGAQGPVTDHVLALDLVTGAGARLGCSPARRPELFDAVRGGLGQVGVVTAVTLALTPVVRACPPPRRRAWLRAFVPEGAVTALVRRLAGPYDEVRVAPVSTAALRTPLLRLPGCARVVRLELAGPPRPIGAARCARRAVLDAGGTVHPDSLIPMTPADWREHFGARQHDRLAAARRIFDPVGLLRPGYTLFEEG